VEKEEKVFVNDDDYLCEKAEHCIVHFTTIMSNTIHLSLSSFLFLFLTSSFTVWILFFTSQWRIARTLKHVHCMGRTLNSSSPRSCESESIP
jgi:hypothetical protein